MNKILLTTFFAVAGALVPSQDAMGMTEVKNMTIYPDGRSEWSKNTQGYNILGHLYICGTIIASSPVQISSGGILETRKMAKIDFRKNLSIIGGKLDCAYGTYDDVADITVAGKLSVGERPSFAKSSNTGRTIIKMRKIVEAENEALPEGSKKTEEELQDADDAIIDVSQLAKQIGSTTIEGKSEYGTAFLGYYNAVDTDGVDCIDKLSEGTYDDKRDSYVTAIRDRLTNLIKSRGYLKYVTLNDVKIQDYVIERHFEYQEQDKDISIQKTTQQTLINDELRTLASNKNLTVVADSRDISTGVASFDFYSSFSPYNKSENSFVEWPSNTLKLSSSAEDTHDEFVFNTKLAPSESCTHDLSVTNGLKDFNTLALSADNTGFASHKIKLNGALNTVVYKGISSYAAIDFSNNDGTTFNLTFSSEHFSTIDKIEWRLKYCCI